LFIKSLITVIVAAKNSSATLQNCINSFKDQTYQSKQLIIIDGGSSDDTAKLLKKNNKYISYWESKLDRGIAHAWNKALEYVDGEWIIFLGADDCFTDSNVLENFNSKIKNHSLKNGRIVYAQIQKLSYKGEYLDIQGMDWNNIRSQFFSDDDPTPSLLSSLFCF
jgi:glycosyltransferase involved in cell wall biosynthesis